MATSPLPNASPAPPDLPDRRWPPALPDVALGFVAGVFVAAFVLARPSAATLAGALRDEHLFSNLQAIATTGAILVGGWWTYARFIRTREDKPRLAVSHAVDSVRLDARRTLVHVTAWIENRGAGLVSVSGIKTRLQHVHPLNDAVLTRLADGWQAGDACLVGWRTVAERSYTRGRHQLEPGERESAAFDFIVDGRLEVASLYTFVPYAGPEGDATPDGRLGWSCRTLYRIPSPESRSPRDATPPRDAMPPRRLAPPDAGHAGAPSPLAAGGNHA